MAAAELPKWIWDLVIAIEIHEDTHPKENGCLSQVLSRVPSEVRAQASVIQSYVAQAQSSELTEKIQRNWGDLMDSLIPAGPPAPEA